MGRNALRVASLAVLGWGLSQPAAAKELKWTHYGTRPLAMGNAYVAVADDYNALFYNPAGLARLKDWDIEMFSGYAAVSNNTVTFAKELYELVGKGGSSVQPVLDLLEKNTGKSHHFALGGTPYLIFPGFGFAAGGEISTTLAVHRDISVDIDAGPRMIAPMAFATNFFEDRLSLGAGIKIVAKGGIERQFSINDIEALVRNSEPSTPSTDPNAPAADPATQQKKAKLDDYVEGGVGVGMDMGLLFTPIKTMSPTLGISIMDFGGTPYKKFDVNGESLGAPHLRLPSVNTGVSIIPWEARDMYVRASMDAHAINWPEHYSKKLNMGVEWGYGSIIKVQSGLHQGALTAGFEFDVFMFSLRFATYEEQLGTEAGQDENLSDRRYVGHLKLFI